MLCLLTNADFDFRKVRVRLIKEKGYILYINMFKAVIIIMGILSGLEICWSKTL
jgi:hypothetical protein